MRCFLGVMPVKEVPFEKLTERGRQLSAEALHFLAERRLALCLGDRLLPCPAHLLHIGVCGAQSAEVLLRLYRRMGCACYSCLAPDVGFFLWDSTKAKLFLGGTGDRRCFVSQEEDGIWFSSEQGILLRAQPVSVGLFSYASFAQKKKKVKAEMQKNPF